MNNKKMGLFYGAIGVATLLLTLIGATFAYFGALISSSNIAGHTLGGNGGVLSLNVTEVTFTGVTANHNLVPTNLTTAKIALALQAKCVGASGYTGCHVYQITATANDDIPSAEINLSQLTYTPPSGVTGVVSDWKYAIFEGVVNTAGTGSSVTTLGNNGNFNVNSPVQVWTGAFSNASGGNNRTVTRYLIVWTADDNSIQDANDSNNSTGSYNGIVELSAGAAGKIRACFGTSGPCALTVYTVNTSERVFINQSIPGTIDKYYDPNGPSQAIAALEEAYYAASNGIAKSLPFFLKHTVENDEVTSSYVGFVVMPNMVATNSEMQAGTYYLKGGDNGASFLANARKMYDAFGELNCSMDGTLGGNPYETTPSSEFRCGTSYFSVVALSSGIVDAYNGGPGLGANCEVVHVGFSHCAFN